MTLLRPALIALLFGASAFATQYNCTSNANGSLSDSSKWNNCNGTYPHNNGGDTYTATVNHAITQDVSSLTLGHDNGPVNGYVSVSGTAGSGYANCSGAAISSGTPQRAAATAVRVVNGACVVQLIDRGFYSGGTPALGSVTTTNTTIAGGSTTRGSPTTLVVNSGLPVWYVGSTQSITISGATGTGWTTGCGGAGINATWTATVTASANSTTTITIPCDSTSFTGTPGGTITVAPGTAASYTLTYQAGGGAAAITVGTAGSLTLGSSTVTTINGDLICASASSNTTTCLNIDGTSASTGSPTVLQTGGSYVYSVSIGTAVNQGYRTTKTTSCAKNASDPTLPGNCKLMGNATYPTRLDAIYLTGPTLSISGLYFKWVGDPSSMAIYHNSSQVAATVTNSLFDKCGRVWHHDLAGQNWTFDHNQFINTDTSASGTWINWVNLELNSGGSVTPNAGDVWSVQYNSLDASLGSAKQGGASFLKGYTIFGDFFGGGANLSNASAWTSWDTNFVRVPIFQTGGNSSNGLWNIAASTAHDYVYLDADSFANPHFLQPPTTSVTVNGIVYGFSGNNSADSGEVVITNTGSASNGLTVQNSVFLCDSTGVGTSEMTTVFGGTTITGYTYTFTHNTWCGGYGTFGGLQINETGATVTGSLIAKSNLFWSNSSSSSLKLDDVGSPATITNASTVRGSPTTLVFNAKWLGASQAGSVYISGATGTGWTAMNGAWTATETANTSSTTTVTIPFDSSALSGTPGGTITIKMGDPCSPTTNCDYNGSYNLASTQSSCSLCQNQAKGYAGYWSCVPGTSGCAGFHDVDGTNPNFVDKTRKVENFDQKYLGKSLEAAWSSGGTYAYNAFVSNSNASMYPGEGSFNYRCINLSGCTGLGAPGVPGTLWRQNWEWASLYWIRLLNYAGTQYTDASINCTNCYVVQALNNWVTAGFAPTNSAFKNAAHDGGDIGAVAAQITNAVPVLTPIFGFANPKSPRSIDGLSVQFPANDR